MKKKIICRSVCLTVFESADARDLGLMTLFHPWSLVRVGYFIGSSPMPYNQPSCPIWLIWLTKTYPPFLCFLCITGRANITTRLKKKAAPYFELKNKKNKWFEHFFVEVIWKIFKFSFILDQSQICISNGLGARACQSYLLICKNAHFSMGLQTENGNVFT